MSNKNYRTPPQQAENTAAKVKRVLEVSPDELDQLELEVVEELLHAATAAVELFHMEAEERKDEYEKGEPVKGRWQVAPGVFNALVNRTLKLLERRRQLRESMRPPRQAA